MDTPKLNYCPNCGIEINGQTPCPKCGCAFRDAAPPRYPATQEDSGGCGFVVLGFFFPPIALILFLVFIKPHPRWANSCALGIFLAYILGVALAVAAYLFFLPYILELIDGFISNAPNNDVVHMLLR
jgi:hypothetical protein